MPVADSLKCLRLQEHRTGLKCSKNTKQNKALQTLKRQSVGGFSFSKTNSCTYRLDRSNKLGAGWLMEVAWPGGSRQRWLARIGNRTSEPLSLDEVKSAAVAMLCERGTTEGRDWIAELNKIAASEVDRVASAKERKRWPLVLIGVHVRFMHRIEVSDDLRKAILDAELPFTDEQLDAPPAAGTASCSKVRGNRFNK
jgi:hypothetical protein